MTFRASNSPYIVIYINYGVIKVIAQIFRCHRMTLRIPMRTIDIFVIAQFTEGDILLTNIMIKFIKLIIIKPCIMIPLPII